MQHEPPRRAPGAARIVLIYAVLASVWILLSDTAAEWLFRDPGRIALADSIKGLAFVAITSLLLYRLLRQRHELAAAAQLQQSQGERLQALDGIKRAEGALRAQLELNQRYLDTVQMIVLALDADGRVTMINRKGCQLLGYASEELLQRDWFEISAPQVEAMRTGRERYRRFVDEQTRPVDQFESPMLCRDGRQRVIGWTVARLRDPAGRIVGTIGSGEDITQRKAAEEALRQQTGEVWTRNAELERFNRAMVGRELDMVALKRQVNDLARELQRDPPFDLAFLGEKDRSGNGESP